MSLNCPICRSQRIVTKDLAKKTCTFVGTVGGAASGAAGAVTGAEIGLALGALAGPIGRGVGGFAGALIGGLVGGATGCLAGARVGAAIDERVLDNLQCLDCGYSFSADGVDPLPPINVQVSTPAATPEAPAAASPQVQP
ncbi:MAG: hypothetical protein KA535_06945 [Azonexus sp.]|nr:hypothetical protein [Azonexus sp.]